MEPFGYDLEKGKIVDPNTEDMTRLVTGYGYYVRYENKIEGQGYVVEIGASSMVGFVPQKHWNTAVGIIRDDKLDRDGIELILERALWVGNEHMQTFISAVKSGDIKEIE